jgi:hypothetical protein
MKPQFEQERDLIQRLLVDHIIHLSALNDYEHCVEAILVAVGALGSVDGWRPPPHRALLPEQATQRLRDLLREIKQDDPARPGTRT